MKNNDNQKPYDLEDRTFNFAKDSRRFVKALPRTIPNIEDVKQFVRASGSIGANYIEANEAIGKKDFVLKIKICRREVKERKGVAGYVCSIQVKNSRFKEIIWSARQLN